MRNSIEASCRLGNAQPSEHADCCARPEEAPATDDPGQRHNKANPSRKIMKLVVGASLISAQRAATSSNGHQSIKCHHHQQASSAKLTLVVVGTSSLLFLLLLVLPQVPCNAQETSRPAESLASSSSGQQVDLKGHEPSSGRSNPSESSEDKRQPTSASLLDDKDQDRDDEEEPLRLSTRLPRQHFRLKVGPTSRASSSFRLINIRRRAAQQQKQQQQGSSGRNWQATKQPPCKADCAEGNGVEVPVVNPPAVVIRVSVGDDGAADTQAQKPPQKSKKLSSAALKKLLAHTLPRLDGGSSTGGGEPADGSGKAPNFKFVFIQRATKVPSGSSQEGSANNNNNRKTGQSGAGTTKPQQQSLAASVSRQLASSLFYSAANFISPNFTQTAAVSPGVNLIPSLSTLAALSSAMRPSSAPDHQSSVADNELVQQAGPGTTAKTLITSSAPYPTQQGPPSRTLLANNEDANSNHIDRDETSNNNNNNLDIKRLSRPPSSAPASQQQQQATKTKRKKSRPSKVYNLPVKFVSNGQPNSVMFQSIKQHFATIKKFQQQQQLGSNNKLMGSETGKARKKLPAGQTRLKGTNSRLIYLPLKYLSNAKPSMLSKVISGASSSGNGAKASHKSSPSSSSSASGTKSIRLH